MEHIVFTRNASGELRNKLGNVEASDVFVLVDSNSRDHCLERLEMGDIPNRHVITIVDGEPNKSLDTLALIWQKLSDGGARRNSVLVNIGGGLVMDIGGFAASCFKRGIACLNIPTTLLAQVDASIGGKTGINFNGLKNEIGTFSTPEEVIIDNTFLRTLPERQVLSGFAEMLKHALLADEEHLAKIMDADLTAVADEDFMDLIKGSVDVKRAIVQGDQWEKGLRRALNLGHTIGHAIESVAIQKNLDIYHGDAVAYGLIAELYLSVKKLGFDGKHYEAVRKFIRERFPVYHSVDDPNELYARMLHDKKNTRKGVNFTLLYEPGNIEIAQYCSKEEVLEALEQI